MFLVGEEPRVRERRIRHYLQSDPSVAVLVAAAHFEWTICRAVLLLSQTPNRELRRRMESVYGLKRYKDLWRDEVLSQGAGSTLPGVVSNWEDVKVAFEWRNRLIHGRDRCTRKMAKPKVEALLEGAAHVRAFCQLRGADFRQRLPVRRSRPGTLPARGDDQAEGTACGCQPPVKPA